MINTCIPERVQRDIRRFAQDASVERIILFGSRARGTNSDHSDIDLAVYGGDFDNFYWNIQENAWSLLRFDLVNMQENVADELLSEIQRDGKVIYEKS